MRAGQESNPRLGFTLIELMVALAIAGLVVFTVHRLFAATIEQSKRVVKARVELDRQENATRWLSAAIASLDVGKDEPGPFVGVSDALEFSTWLLGPYGWHEADRITVRRDGTRLVGRLRGGREILLADSVAAAEFDYLIEGGEAAPWLQGWTSSVNPPLAVRLRLYRTPDRTGGPERADTSLFLVGARG